MFIDIVANPVEFEGYEYLRIRSEVELCFFISSTQVKMRRLKALWDTGATNTCIPMELAVTMNIPLRGETTMQLGTVDQPSRFCSFCLRFPGEHYEYVRDGVAVPGSRNQLVIGMDIMKRGKSTIIPNEQGGVHFTFTISDNNQ
jgi:hypothetical protein